MTIVRKFVVQLILLPLVVVVAQGEPKKAWAQSENDPAEGYSLEESQIIAEDRRVLQEAIESGRSTKIMAARKQLSDDMARISETRRVGIKDIVIPLHSDNQGHFFVEVMINNRIPATLMLDTGAPVVLLSSRFASELGVSPGRDRVGYMMVLNGQHAAAEIYLRSLKVGRAEKRDVYTAVLLSGNAELEDKFKDGLLGMSFLEGYHYSIDHPKQRLILRKSK